MGAVLSCIQDGLRAIGGCLMAIVNGIGNILMAIVSGIVSIFNAIISCLTCGSFRRRRSHMTMGTTTTHRSPRMHRHGLRRTRV
ncbi:hypothetical protein PAAG_04565 [Paracoccidioides lutzii Pb01]|uniref:Uncharacterized protein n=1 Tax=Paracoccidioides lutzii (strain ATCC MYA-826 / Pb01) TaxID=502779 RepID=C1H1C1_PARBA|nr:hypothetical protein PAAG_04565 [Paracoccidioides lutzii Pb01]EEH33515.2 hypothetical protein PAAG_04565 [Paracoccidioides lutzii Pb01]